MKRFVANLLLAGAWLMCVRCAQAATSSYTFSTIDVPGATQTEFRPVAAAQPIFNEMESLPRMGLSGLDKTSERKRETSNSSFNDMRVFNFC